MSYEGPQSHINTERLKQMNSEQINTLIDSLCTELTHLREEFVRLNLLLQEASHAQDDRLIQDLKPNLQRVQAELYGIMELKKVLAQILED